MITYGQQSTDPFAIRVYLEKKWVGTIVKAKGDKGFFYHPKAGLKFKGETFPTVDAVKETIEAP